MALSVSLRYSGGAMTTITSSVAHATPVAAPAASTVLNQDITPAIDQRLNEIAAEKARITALDEEQARLMREKEETIVAWRKEVAKTVPGLFGVATIEEAIALMREDAPSVPKGRLVYSDEVRAQVKAAMAAKTPVAQISRHFHISEATLWIWRRGWGFTKGSRRAPRFRKTKPIRHDALSPDQKQELLRLLGEGKVPVTKLSKQFHRSRARIYQLAHAHHVTLPSLHAA